MAISTITNTDIDNACAAVEAPYGPLTRVGAAPNTAPNSNLSVEVQSALSVNFFITYEDLVNEDVLNKILADVHGGTSLNHQAYLATIGVSIMNAHLQAMAGPPYTDTEWQDLINAFRFFDFLAGLIPDTAYIEYDEDPIALTSLTTADNGTQEGQVDTVITNRYQWVVVDWGDGTVDTVTPNATTGAISETHTYAGAGTYTMKVQAMGAGGIIERQADQAIA